MALPSWISAGTADTVLNPSPLTPSYPASPQFGDLFIIHVATRSNFNATTAASASGWGALPFEDNGSTTTAHYLYKWSNGTETGTVAVTPTGMNSGAYAHIHLFRNVGGNPGTPNIESIDVVRATSTTPSPDPVITTDVDRCAVCITTVADDTSTTHTLTGGSGGTWSKHTEISSPDGSDVRMLMQTAPMASADTFSGATGTMASSKAWICRTFALYGGPIVRLPSDAVTLAEGIARTGTFIRATPDALAHSDVAEGVKNPRFADDTLSLADVITSIKVNNRSISDALASPDTATRTASLNRAIADALGLSDAAIATRILPRSIADALSLSDLAESIKVLPRSSVDTLSLSDVATRIGSLDRAASDILVLADVATGTRIILRITTDALDLNDTAEAIKIDTSLGIQGQAIWIG